MDMQLIHKEREYSQKERTYFSQLIEQNKANGATAVDALKHNEERLHIQEVTLRDSISKTVDPEQKLKLYYHLLITINLRQENNELIALVDNYKSDLFGPAFNKALTAEKYYYIEKEHLLDKKMQELQDAYIKRAQYLALLEINPPSEDLQRLEAQALNHSYLSMHELISMPLSRDYEEISAAMDQVSQNQYKLYMNLANICDAAIKSSDLTKQLAQKDITNNQTAKPSQQGRSELLTSKASFFGNSVKKTGSKESLQLKQLQNELEVKRVAIHQQLAQIKSAIGHGKFDKVQLAKTQFENDLVNQALKKIIKAQEIVNSDLISGEFVKQQAKIKLDIKRTNNLTPSQK